MLAFLCLQQVSASPDADGSVVTVDLAALQCSPSAELVSPPYKFQCLSAADDIEFSPSNMSVCAVCIFLDHVRSFIVLSFLLVSCNIARKRRYPYS